MYNVSVLPNLKPGLWMIWKSKGSFMPAGISCVNFIFMSVFMYLSAKVIARILGSTDQYWQKKQKTKPGHCTKLNKIV